MHLLGSPVIDVMAHFGPRSHEAHLAAEHVDQLGKLVEFELADEVAGARNARVVAADGDEASFVGSDTHGAELEDAEIPVVASYAHLAVEDGAGGVELDPHGEDQEEGAQEDESQSAGHYVEQPFHRCLTISTKLEIT